ncbi:transcription initiation factor TFIID subunit 8 [Neltuma alba]|uniref:transcription initiation factor TFIID subunit 8 n=1 Tax=Neltuma alba TaxID=207710 RepID=UPI0010A4D40E|nr:transcription initiation factor TFIID subunit 8-like [Prosopis alba]
MGDGAGETGRQLEQPNTRRKLGGDDFAQAIAKVAVGQVCESEGFHAIQRSSLETLSDIAVRYIQNVGKTARCHANLAGRTECNVFDIMQGLEDIGSAQGFLGASVIDHCVGSSGIVREIIQFVTETEPVPFAYAVPKFPVVKERVLTPSFLQIEEEPPAEHIPAWLPTFPDPQTYSWSPTMDKRGTESYVSKLDLEREHSKGERYLLNLQPQMVSNVAEKSALIETTNAKGKKVAGESNPFLAAPLQFGEKEVASVTPPPKLFNDVAAANPAAEDFVEDRFISVLDTFAPAIEAMKSSQCDFDEEQSKLLLNRRPHVHFKIGIKKNFVGRLVDSGPQNENDEKTLPRFVMEGEKDDRKKRAEKILKESLENPDELVQL